jgi:large subunit ribosomal protein L37Ae
MVVGYGKSIRKAVEEANRKAHSKYKCPSCSRTAVQRQANGIWQCKKCKVKFASGAFSFKQ